MTSATICLGAFTFACGTDGTAVATGPGEIIPEWVGVVSNAIRLIPDPTRTVAFVSLPPGTLQVADRASIRNVRTNAQATVTVTNGGFDPVRIAARAGDSLRITVEVLSGQPLLYTAAVPVVHRPVVVRTEPGGDGEWWYTQASRTRAASQDVTAIISFSDDDGDVWSRLVTGSIEPGGPPTFFTGGTWVQGC